MYCILKYSEIDKQENDGKATVRKQSMDSKASSVDRSGSQKSVEKEIRYCDEVKELLINPNCLTRILLDYVCEQLCIDKNAEIDFCDENGRLAKINDLKNWEYATETLKPQMAYVVIKFQRGKGGKFKSIRPVLTKTCKLYADIVFYLKSQFSSSSIYISDKSSSKSFGRRASMKSSDKRRLSSVHSKTGESDQKGSELLKSSSKNTLHSKTSRQSSSKSAKAHLFGADSEVEIKKGGKTSVETSSSKEKRKKSPK